MSKKAVLTLPPFVSEYRSPGGNKKTDELRTLFSNVLKILPDFRCCPEMDPYPGDERIRAIRFSGLPCEGRSTEVFAYLGIPADASAASPVPGMVLIHGGGGHAYAEWVRAWTDRGYAAISFDGFAQQYVGSHARYDASLEFWTNDPASYLPVDFFSSADKPFMQQWFTYYISDILLAHSLLRADARIQKDRIGLTGISWGGFAASVAVCYDDRFSFAAPVYGCGFQDVSQTEWGRCFRGKGISDVWDAKLLLPTVSTPVHWFNGDSDPFFDAVSSTASAAAAQNAALTLLPAFTHGQTEGSAIPELFRFADEQTGRGKGNIRILSVEISDGKATLRYSLPQDSADVSAFIFYKTEDLKYTEKELNEGWKHQKGEAENGTAVLSIPGEARFFYFFLIEKSESAEEALRASSGVISRRSIRGRFHD